MIPKFYRKRSAKKISTMELEQKIEELAKISLEKDAEIFSLKDTVKYQEKIIIRQIDEITKLCAEVVNFYYYKPHFMDNFKVRFGPEKFHESTFRSIISSREGRELCGLCLSSEIPTESSAEFKQYLMDINYTI